MIIVKKKEFYEIIREIVRDKKKKICFKRIFFFNKCNSVLIEFTEWHYNDRIYLQFLISHSKYFSTTERNIVKDAYGEKVIELISVSKLVE